MSDRSCGLAIYFHLRGWFSAAVGILSFALDDNFISRLLIDAFAARNLLPASYQLIFMANWNWRGS